MSDFFANRFQMVKKSEKITRNKRSHFFYTNTTIFPAATMAKKGQNHQSLRICGGQTVWRRKKLFTVLDAYKPQDSAQILTWEK